MHTRAHIRRKPPSLPFDRQHCILVREWLLQYARDLINGAVASPARRIEMRRNEKKSKERGREIERETEKEGERDEEMGVGARRKGTKEGPKGSPGIMATTLRSGLRAPKSRPVSMPGHRHSFEAYVMHVRCCRIAARVRLLRSTVPRFGRPDETLAADRRRHHRRRSVHVGCAYGCETIGYLLLCIWHIVKLIERDDKIAMFFDVKRGERLASETESVRQGETKGREPREGGGLTRG